MLTQSSAEKRIISVLIVDDHLLVSETLAAGLKAVGDFELDVVGDLDMAIEKISLHGRYDVVMLDYQIPGVHGFEGLRTLIATNNGGVALFSGVASWSIVDSAIREGANGFIPKTISLVALTYAIRFIADGESYLPSGYMKHLWGRGDLNFGIKPREMRVLSFLCEGMMNKEIAHEIGVEEMIVKMDVKSICRKLGVKNRTGAAMTARRNGIF